MSGTEQPLSTLGASAGATRASKVLRSDDGGSALPISTLLSLIALTDLPTTGAAIGYVLTFNGTSAQWELATGSGGIPGANGESFRAGTGAPGSGLGAAGDSYVDLATGEVWQNVSGRWTDAGVSLKGPQGATGATGPAGSGGGSAWPSTVNRYTASVTLPITDDMSIVNSASALTFTLPNDTVDGHVHRIKRFGPGTVTINAMVDGASISILLQASGPPFESCDFEWNAAFSSYLAVGGSGGGVGIAGTLGTDEAGNTVKDEAGNTGYTTT